MATTSVLKKLWMATAGAGLIVGTAGSPAMAVNLFQGQDSNVGGPGSPLPNSDAAAAQFDNAASTLGAVNKIDFEKLPTGNFSSLQIPPDVTLALSNTGSNTDPRPVFDSAGITNDTANSYYGFNTTSGGSNFFRLSTKSTAQGNQTVATATFSFAKPVPAFGTYITARDQGSGGQLSFLLNGDPSQRLQVTGNPNCIPSCAQFFGFTAPGNSISSLVVQDEYTSPLSHGIDQVGIDDVRYVNSATAVPAPSSTLGLLTLVGLIGGSALKHQLKLGGLNNDAIH